MAGEREGADASNRSDASRPRVVRRRVLIVAGVGAIVFGIAIGLVILLRNGNFPTDLDERFSVAMRGIRGGFGDVLAFGMNTLGGTIVGGVFVPLAVILLLVVVRRPWGALYFSAASLASLAVQQGLKQLFGRPRPEDLFVATDFGSFPSGHVANAATIAVVVGVLVPRAWVWALGAAYTVLMAVSRTYLGAHWLSDTVGGALIGAGVALVVWAAFARPLERERLAWGERRRARHPEPRSLDL